MNALTRPNLTHAFAKADKADRAERLRDRPFDPWRVPRTDSMRAVVKAVTYELECHRARQRRRAIRSDQRSSFEATVTALVCDVARHASVKEPGRLHLSRSNREIEGIGRYRPPAINGFLRDSLDDLTALGFIEQRIGVWDATSLVGEQTTIKAGARLVRLLREHGIISAECTARRFSGEVIQLSRRGEGFWDDDLELMRYEDSETTNRLRREVETINAWLAEAPLDFDQYEWPSAKPAVDLDNTSLVRRFTRGTFDCGGRLWGGFWMPLSKKDRLGRILIDGEHVVSLDYKQMSVRIAYGLVDEPVPELTDLYEVDGLKGHRRGAKQLLNALFFAEKPITSKPKGTANSLPARRSVEGLIADLARAHPALAPHFCEGMGHRIQRIESDIMVGVLLDLIEQGVVALPVHDAVAVSHIHEKQAVTTMCRVFTEHTGIEAGVDREG